MNRQKNEKQENADSADLDGKIAAEMSFTESHQVLAEKARKLLVATSKRSWARTMWTNEQTL